MEIGGAHSAIAHLRTASSSSSNSGVRSQSNSEGPTATGTQHRAHEKQQQQETRNLASRDREVRSHEQAHAAAGGVHAGTPQYELTKGSNGVTYATGGHVNIDLSGVPGDAQATLDKMQTVQRAALAPAQPSAQDRAVAAEASARATEARAELRSARAESLTDSAQTRENETAEPSVSAARSNEKISAYQSAQTTRDGHRTAGATVDAYA